MGNGICDTEGYSEACDFVEYKDCESKSLLWNTYMKFIILNLVMYFNLECVPDWIGDTICDEFNNHEPCHFDANDCCGDLGPHQFSTCFECVCKT